MTSEERHEGETGARRAGDESPDAEEAAVVRHEEELGVGAETRQFGSVRVRKSVESEHVDEVIPRAVEDFHDVERTRPNEQDSGEVETLPDGSVSIPILEEELVISKRTVVRERVVVRKRTETRDERVQAEVRKERVEVDADTGVDLDEDER